jgi:uncharacterized protein YbjT (DUF2867 family)
MTSSRLVTVFGASGFIGRHLVQNLARRGWRIRAASRRPDMAGHLQPMGGVGQIHAVQANLRYPDSVRAAIEGADSVVNLVGILHQRGRQSFAALQQDGAGLVANIARKAGVQHLVHLSAIGADKASSSLYAQSKALGEKSIKDAFAEAVILRPSVIFGSEDQVFNRFATLGRLFPVVPITAGQTRFQPVYVGDVATMIAMALEGQIRSGRTYELGGPEIITLKALVAYALEQSGRRKPIVDLPLTLARFQASLLETLDALTFGSVPASLMITRDQITLLQQDNVVSEEAEAQGRTLEGAGLAPTPFEAIVPASLVRFRPHGQFEKQADNEATPRQDGV